ncbi:MAG: TetR/AcrR family transcriptional regulator [Eubacteriales bacterium]|nr:TetR/AcrR family transcriptional regulator [Eubacteriales bacterium]MDD3290363.1 TetR/AcrR family transcriptional regulator [Eubacteriales bacterium]MDD3864272.1 TetR/AcrR family transcriptional regulator [Eubacteriales bacterium]MDD4444671.1 TetR/AcrR family transcriptional regulator [Eubacteriales bacterium]
MPKTFSDSERAYIRERLMEEGKACLSLYGIRRTTVDELVKRVKIPKGTFYLFYESKDLLFFEIFCTLHDEMQEKLLAELAVLEGDMDADTLTNLFFSLYKSLDDSFLLNLITSGELELLFRKLPPEAVKQHAEMDDFRVEELVSLVPNLKAQDIRVFSAAMRGIFISLLHKREVGEEVFDEALRVMLRGVVLQMFEGESS